MSSGTRDQVSRSPRLGLFRVADFRRFYGATLAGQLADRLVFLALPLVAIVWLDADEFEVGVLTALTTTGSLLIGLPAGAWVDRWRKRPVMISTLGVLRIRKPEPRPQHAVTRHLIREVREGLRFVLGHPLLRPILFTDGIFSLFLITYQTMLLVFLSRHLDLGSFGIGLVLSVMASGGLTGALLARRVINRIGPGPAVWLATLCTAPTAAILPLARPGWLLWLAATGLALVSAGGVIRLVSQVGLQQAATPDRLLGRMSATVRFVQWGSMPIGALLGGLLGGLLGAQAVLFIGAFGMTAAFLPAFLSPLAAARELPATAAT